MQQASQSTRVSGILLAVGGGGFFAAGLMHPHDTGVSLRPVVIDMLRNPLWSGAHWVSFASVVLLVLAIWVLMDEGWTGDSAVAKIGARLTVIGGIFMLVEFAVELAARGAIAPLTEGRAVPMFNLFAATHAAGWPTFSAGLVLVVLGVRAVAPLPIRILGVVGAAAMGIAGVLVAGFYLTSYSWLFIGGELLAIWIVWAGVQTARGAAAMKIAF